MESAYNIKLGRFKFRLDNRSFSADKENNMIHPCLKSIKFLNQKIATKMYSLRNKKYDTFTDMLVELTEGGIADTRQIDILIRLNYFEEFGKTKKLCDIYDFFTSRYKKTYVEKTKALRLAEVKEFEANCKDEALSPDEIIKTELIYLGYATTTVDYLSEEYNMVAYIDFKYTNPIVTLYGLRTGDTTSIKVKNKLYTNNQFKMFDLLKVDEIIEDFKWFKAGADWKRSEDKEKLLSKWSIIK